MVLQRISHEQLSLDDMAERNVQYRRRISSEGLGYTVEAHLDRKTYDALLSTCENLIVWCQDEDEGNFHAIMEVQGDRDIEDPLYSAEKLVATHICLLVTDNVFDPTKFDPKVFA
jgi:hypothetical protein